MLELKQAGLVYRDADNETWAIRDASLTVEPGQFIGLLGPSGSGKSTLLYLLSGLKLPSEGFASINNIAYDKLNDLERSYMRQTLFGFIFQQPYLLGYLSVYENVMLASVDGEKSRERAEYLLEQLGLIDKAKRYPHSLSGGEKQRVCVARALINNPLVVFADEPTASLDLENGLAVVKLLKENRGDGAVVFVTHDPQMLQEAEEIYTVRGGKVIQDSM